MTTEPELPEPDWQIDATGLRCPQPIIELGLAAQRLGSGVIELLADDPVALQDVPAWCVMRSAELLHQHTGDAGSTTFLVRVRDVR